jgi:hypothetical protein
MMSSANPTAGSIPLPADAAEQMALYGIIPVPAYNFEIGGYRYTQLGDAVAEAKRRRSAENRS